MKKFYGNQYVGSHWDQIKRKLNVFGIVIIVIGFAVGSWNARIIVAPVYAEKQVPVIVIATSTPEFPPFLKKICTSESQWQQFEKDGRHIKRGAVNPSDVGICQINEPYWDEKAKDMGLDIFTRDGNMEMARWLYNNFGSQPWKSSMCIKNGWGSKSDCAVN